MKEKIMSENNDPKKPFICGNKSIEFYIHNPVAFFSDFYNTEVMQPILSKEALMNRSLGKKWDSEGDDKLFEQIKEKREQLLKSSPKEVFGEWRYVGTPHSEKLDMDRLKNYYRTQTGREPSWFIGGEYMRCSDDYNLVRQNMGVGSFSEKGVAVGEMLASETYFPKKNNVPREPWITNPDCNQQLPRKYDFIAYSIHEDAKNSQAFGVYKKTDKFYIAHTLRKLDMELWVEHHNNIRSMLMGEQTYIAMRGKE